MLQVSQDEPNGQHKLGVAFIAAALLLLYSFSGGMTEGGKLCLFLTDELELVIDICLLHGPKQKNNARNYEVYDWTTFYLCCTFMFPNCLSHIFAFPTWYFFLFCFNAHHYICFVFTCVSKV